MDDSVYVGGQNYLGQVVDQLNGCIDDIRIYNRELSSNEISDLYHEHGWTGN